MCENRKSWGGELLRPVRTPYSSSSTLSVVSEHVVLIRSGVSWRRLLGKVGKHWTRPSRNQSGPLGLISGSRFGVKERRSDWTDERWTNKYQDDFLDSVVVSYLLFYTIRTGVVRILTKVVSDGLPTRSRRRLRTVPRDLSFFPRSSLTPDGMNSRKNKLLLLSLGFESPNRLSKLSCFFYIYFKDMNSTTSELFTNKKRD